jgi:glyceraldehyde 3-phosphate dehydrogenase
VALDSALQAQIDYSVSPEVVSSDLVGNPHAGIVDSVATIAHDNNLILYVWYDNEYGYSCQVMRLLQEMAGVSPRQFPGR